MVVRLAATLAARLRLSAQVMGMIIVGFATSALELATMARAALGVVVMIAVIIQGATIRVLLE